MFLKITSNPIVRQYIVVIVVNLGAFCLGLNFGWPSPVLVKLQNATQTVLPEPLTESQGGWMLSVSFIIGGVANFLAPYLLDAIGRKNAALVACIPRVIACLLFVFAQEFWMLILGRAVSGAADALSINAVSVYATEVASKEIRGRLGTILQISASLGIVIMLSIGPFVSYLAINIMFTCLTVFAYLPIVFLPDSPYFLYAKGRTDEAIKVLTFLRGSSELAKEEMKEYNSARTETTMNKLELFRNVAFLKGVAIVVVLGIGQQLIGFQAVSFYLQTILVSTGTSLSPEISSVIIGFIQLTASIVVVLIMDRFGRKVILGVTLSIMCFGMFGLGLFFQLSESKQTVTGALNFLPLASLIFVVFGYSAGPGSIFWLLIAELFDDPARTFGVSIYMVDITLMVFFLTNYFHHITTAIGPALTYWIFGVNCILLALFIIFCMPETKGRTIAEIQVSLGAKRAEDLKNSGTDRVDKTENIRQES